MGQPKGLLVLEERTFVSRVVHALLEGGCEAVFVAVRRGDEALTLAAETAGAHVVVNEDPADGPITSVRTVLNQLDPEIEAICLLPLDHPRVTAATVSLLVEAASTSGAALTLPRYRGKRGHPAIFRRSLFPELLDAELEGGARTIVHAHLDRARIVEMADDDVTIDVDTPSDYARLHHPRSL